MSRGKQTKCNEKILQMIPANGWWATYEDIDAEGRRVYFAEALAMWVLVEISSGVPGREPKREVRGLSGYEAAWGGELETLDNFYCYVRADSMEEAIEEAGRL